MREKWLVLLVIKVKSLIIAIAATKISASDIIFPCPLSVAYISAALMMTSSVIGTMLLALQKILNVSICFCAFFAFNPLSISYFVCERWLVYDAQ